ncbi:MAG: hypothetical protein PHC62_00810 [Candidatus Izemoplasmatales bacterium]|nr:hypothetical protein [Candidatus Izemoplasmatales bacterium]
MKDIKLMKLILDTLNSTGDIIRKVQDSKKDVVVAANINNMAKLMELLIDEEKHKTSKDTDRDCNVEEEEDPISIKNFPFKDWKEENGIPMDLYHCGKINKPSPLFKENWVNIIKESKIQLTDDFESLKNMVNFLIIEKMEMEEMKMRASNARRYMLESINDFEKLKAEMCTALNGVHWDLKARNYQIETFVCDYFKRKIPNDLYDKLLYDKNKAIKEEPTEELGNNIFMKDYQYGDEFLKKKMKEIEDIENKLQSDKACISQCMLVDGFGKKGVDLNKLGIDICVVMNEATNKLNEIKEDIKEFYDL